MRGPVPGSHRATTSKRAHHSKPMKKGRKGKKLRSMTIEPATNGGFVVRHSMESNGMDGSGWQEPEQHALGTAQELHDHVAEHFQVSKGRGNLEEAGEAMPDDGE